MAIFYTSDSHFFHKNICGKDGFEIKREKFTVDEMNEELIKQWNSVVGYNDEVYHLGDFALHTTKSKLIDVIQRLNGRIHWIAGNHDSFKNSRSIVRRFEGDTIDGLPKIEFHEVGLRRVVDGYTLYLCHYGMLTGARPKVFSIHGHIHSEPSMYDNHINVGVDNIEFDFKDIPFGQPISEERLMESIRKREEYMIANGLVNSRDHVYRGDGE